MELRKTTKRVGEFFRKYRYIAIILLAGVLFMCLPNRNTTQDTKANDETIAAQMDTTMALDESLSEILSQIHGAGNVRVLLTLQRGEETIYQTDSHTTVNDESNSTQIDTVMITGSERGQSGLIKQINPPIYMGAIVVCQGADSPSVRLAVVEAVSKVTGLGADRISVLKMK